MQARSDNNPPRKPSELSVQAAARVARQVVDEVQRTRKLALRGLRDQYSIEHKDHVFRQRLGWLSPSYLSQLIGPNPRRYISEKAARRIERSLGLPIGWLDDKKNAQPFGETKPPTNPGSVDTPSPDLRGTAPGGQAYAAAMRAVLEWFGEASLTPQQMMNLIYVVADHMRGRDEPEVEHMNTLRRLVLKDLPVYAMG